MVSFKLSQPGDNAVRKANFDRNPSWGQLAAKVESLFKLPSNEVGLSYVDTDGDAVTISTDEELADFYASGASKAPKFTVIRLAPRAPSVAQVPDGFYRSESPEPVIVEERDWGRQRMGSMPFSTLPPNVLNSMNFGFMPGEVDGRAGTPAYSEARIEEIPSSEASRSQSVNEDYSRGSKNNSNNNRSKEGKFNPMERSQRPAKGRQITDLSAVDSTDEPERAPPRPRDSIDSDMGSDIEDLDRPRVRRGASASVQVNGAPSIYDDIAGVISALNQILIRSANGTYLQPQLENATSAANRAAIEDSARRVTESLEGVLRTLGTHSSNPRGAGFGIGTASSGVNTPAEERANLRAPLSSNGRPRPSSMMNGQAIGGTSPNQPSFNSSPRNEPAPQGAPDGRIPPFVPPSFPQKFNPQQRGPTFAGGPANQQPRGFFGEGPPTQAPRPMGQERQFSGNRFQPAAGPQSQRTPRQDSYQPEVSPETLSAFGTDEQSTQQDEREKERERLEAARQLYKQEKANFRAQREAERQERAERRARREKGGPEAAQLLESLEAVLRSPMQSENTQIPQPIRPTELSGLFAPPTQSNYHAAEPEEEDWGRSLPNPPPWQRPMRGPNHEQNERLISRLADMGFSEASQPQLPGVVRQQTKNNLGKSDDEIIERILEVLISADRAPPAPRPGPSGGRRR